MFLFMYVYISTYGEKWEYITMERVSKTQKGMRKFNSLRTAQAFKNVLQHYTNRIRKYLCQANQCEKWAFS